MKPILVRLPKGMAEKIDQIAGGKNRRAAFIREAVEREIERRERQSDKD
ncbi:MULTISPECIES: YlcI/YnfO family protein [unclassified Mesorhizobium]|nr:MULTISPECIES: YlcI/YnfO family protein [unclassified Mesorhizobium]